MLCRCVHQHMVGKRAELRRTFGLGDASALDVQSPGLPQFTTILALRRRSSLLYLTHIGSVTGLLARGSRAHF